MHWNASTIVFYGQNLKTFDISQAFLSLNVVELTTVINSPVFGPPCTLLRDQFVGLSCRRSAFLHPHQVSHWCMYAEICAFKIQENCEYDQFMHFYRLQKDFTYKTAITTTIIAKKVWMNDSDKTLIFSVKTFKLTRREITLYNEGLETNCR